MDSSQPNSSTLLNDEKDVLKSKVTELLDQFSQAKTVVVLTGPDFTGYKDPRIIHEPLKNPQKSHMAIKKLFDEGKIQYVITTNTDGLHRISGIPNDRLIELNGSPNQEFCTNEKCERVYYRDVDVRKLAQKMKQKGFMRRCDDKECHTKLMEGKVDFEESAYSLSKQAQEWVDNSDLQLSLGFPLEIKTNNYYINTQVPTSFANSLVINCPSDSLLSRLLTRMDLKLTPYTHISWLRMMKYIDKKQKECLLIEELDTDRLPFSLFADVAVNGKIGRDRAMTEFKETDLTVQIEVTQNFRDRPELSIQVPTYLVEKMNASGDELWISMHWNPNLQDTGGWEKAVAYNQKFVRIENLRTADIFKRDYTPQAIAYQSRTSSQNVAVRNNSVGRPASTRQNSQQKPRAQSRQGQGYVKREPTKFVQVGKSNLYDKYLAAKQAALVAKEQNNK